MSQRSSLNQKAFGTIEIILFVVLFIGLAVVGQMQNKVETLATQESLDAVAAELNTIKTAVTDTNKDVLHLDRRITILEQAA